MGAVAGVAFGASDTRQCRQPLWRKCELISELFWGRVRFDSLSGEPRSTLILCIPLVVLHLCSLDGGSTVLCSLKNHLPFQRTQILSRQPVDTHPAGSGRL